MSRMKKKKPLFTQPYIRTSLISILNHPQAKLCMPILVTANLKFSLLVKKLLSQHRVLTQQLFISSFLKQSDYTTSISFSFPNTKCSHDKYFFPSILSIIFPPHVCFLKQSQFFPRSFASYGPFAKEFYLATTSPNFEGISSAIIIY